MLHVSKGEIYTSVVIDSKKGQPTNVANVTFPTKPHERGNMLHTLSVEFGVCVIVTTNINVPDGLRNGGMGTVANTVMEMHTSRGGKSIESILVELISAWVGMAVIQQNKYKVINSKAVPTEKDTSNISHSRQMVIPRFTYPVFTFTFLYCEHTQVPGPHSSGNC